MMPSMYANTATACAEDRVRKFQKTGDEGCRVRSTGAANAFTTTTPQAPSTAPPPSSSSAAAAAAALPPSSSRPLPSSTTSAPGRGRGKVPLGPRERPHDFSKQRYRRRTHARTLAW